MTGRDWTDGLAGAGVGFAVVAVGAWLPLVVVVVVGLALGVAVMAMAEHNLSHHPPAADWLDQWLEAGPDMGGSENDLGGWWRGWRRRHPLHAETGGVHTTMAGHPRPRTPGVAVV